TPDAMAKAMASGRAMMATVTPAPRSETKACRSYPAILSRDRGRKKMAMQADAYSISASCLHSSGYLTLPRTSCHPERGTAPARTHQRGKPESKDLGFVSLLPTDDRGLATAIGTPMPYQSLAVPTSFIWR